MFKNINQKISDINSLLNKKLKYFYLLNFFCIFLVSMLDIISIGSIFLFISVILDPSKFLSNYNNIEIVNYILKLDYEDRIVFLSIGLILIFVLKGIVAFLSHYVMGKFNYETINHVSSKLFKGYLDKDFIFHIKNNPSLLHQRIHNETNHASMYLEWLLKFINSIFLVSGILILLLYNSSFIGFFNVLIIILVLIVSRHFFRNQIKKRAEVRSKNDAELFKTLQHAFGSFIETVLFKKENFFLNYFVKHLRIREFQTLYLNLINSLPKIFLEIILVTALSLFFIFFIKTSEDLIDVLPLLTLIIVSLIRLMPALYQLLLSINQLKFLTYGKNLIINELNEIEKDLLIIKNKTGNEKFDIKDRIMIQDLSFKYDNSEQYIFNNLNFEIKKGDKIAMVGESGVGKSTFINVLTGLLNPSTGNIIVDGKSIFENVKNWQEIISYIPQDIYLIDDTIEKNITFSTQDEQIDKAWVDEVLRLSNIYDEINALKDKTQTFVGNRGIRFSGGQKQRLAVARALYKKPQILIMDEPTSGLDKENEEILINNILSVSKNITLIMISHNIDRHKDKFIIYKLKNGFVKKEG